MIEKTCIRCLEKFEPDDDEIAMCPDCVANCSYFHTGVALWRDDGLTEEVMDRMCKGEVFALLSEGDKPDSVILVDIYGQARELPIKGYVK